MTEHLTSALAAFPIWVVEETGDVIFPDEKDLPIDPLETEPPKWAQENMRARRLSPKVMHGTDDIIPTPLINANWRGLITGKAHGQGFPDVLARPGIRDYSHVAVLYPD